MKSRHRAREVALQILYQFDLETHSTGQAAPGQLDLINNLKTHFEHFTVHEDLREFVAQLVAGTLDKMTDLDPLIEKHASNWKVARMSSVDRSLLRMSTYEMLHLKETPHVIIIDEAVELAKQFGTSDTPAFINGILDTLKDSPEQTS